MQKSGSAETFLLHDLSHASTSNVEGNKPLVPLPQSPFCVEKNVSMCGGLPDGDGQAIVYSYRPAWEAYIENARVRLGEDLLRKSTVPLEQITAHVFMFAGEDDQVWPAADYVREIAPRLTNAQTVTSIIVPGAGHKATFTGFPTVLKHNLYLNGIGGDVNPEGIEWAYTGGTTEQNHEANLRQTEGLKKFFKAIFTEER